MVAEEGRVSSSPWEQGLGFPCPNSGPTPQHTCFAQTVSILTLSLQWTREGKRTFPSGNDPVRQRAPDFSGLTTDQPAKSQRKSCAIKRVMFEGQQDDWAKAFAAKSNE